MSTKILFLRKCSRGVDVLLYAKPTDDISNLVLAELGIDPPSPNN